MLEVVFPVDGERLTTKAVTFTGRTEPGASVLASGKFPATVSADGSWSVGLVLAPGANGVVFSATDSASHETAVRITVYPDQEAPKESTTTTTKTAEVPVWEFTANQKYGSCSEPIPYDVCSGTGKPGTIVTVTSPYGSGSVSVGETRKWNVKVEFPSAPYNKEFTVTAKDFAGTKKSFQFTNYYTG